MPKKKNHQKRKTSKSGKNRTPIIRHTRQGSTLVPPFAKLPNVALASWVNERLPEMLWAILIVAAFDRDHALGQFRRLIDFIGRHDQKENLYDMTLTGISKLEPCLQKELIAFLIEPPETAQTLATLRLFKSLPGRESWDELLPQVAPNLELLMDAVGSTLWHQSQEATDCRWMRIMADVVSGMFHIPLEIAQEWFNYPNEEDQQKVRPSIRAAELAIQDPRAEPDLTWPNAFWQEAWENTPCLELIVKREQVAVDTTITRARIREIVENLEDHWSTTHSTTAIDAKHDGVFGTAFYALRLLDELIGIGIGTTVLGRLGLRTILEVHINLRYLISQNDGNLWKKWREYGAGQAKLSALKFDDNIEPPKHVNIETIEQIAGEDIWEEFVSINLAGWSGLDLRRLSETVNLKDIYDQHFSWTAGYVHGMWGPIRESCFETCGNPLHRLHRYPDRKTLPDTVDDAAMLVDSILEDLDQTFPGFPYRLFQERADAT